MCALKTSLSKLGAHLLVQHGARGSHSLSYGGRVACHSLDAGGALHHVDCAAVALFSPSEARLGTLTQSAVAQAHFFPPPFYS